MKKFTPLILLGVLVAAWFGYLAFKDRGKLAELRLLTTGEMSNFVIFEKPKPLPETPFFNRKGETIRFADFKGKTTLVNVWATWCEPCREEMPTLNTLQIVMAGQNFQVITLSIDWQGYKVIDPFLEEYKITDLDAYWDKSNRLPNQLEVVGLPLTILISSDGEWIGRMDGPAVWNSNDAITLMQKAAEQ